MAMIVINTILNHTQSHLAYKTLSPPIYNYALAVADQGHSEDPEPVSTNPESPKKPKPYLDLP